MSAHAWLTHDQVSRAYRAALEEAVAALPEIYRSEWPQDSPQEYECGCVAVQRITCRQTRDRPFEMVLATPCDAGAGCELAEMRARTAHTVSAAPHASSSGPTRDPSADAELSGPPSEHPDGTPSACR